MFIVKATIKDGKRFSTAKAFLKYVFFKIQIQAVEQRTRFSRENWIHPTISESKGCFKGFIFSKLHSSPFRECNVFKGL